jgi:hypothetical protein
VLGIIAGLAVALAGVFYQSWLPGMSNALALATTHQTEPFTELSFVNPTNLPKVVSAKQPATFRYAVTNHQGQQTIYHANIAISENGRLRSLGQNQFTLANDNTQDVVVSFMTASPNTNLEVFVTLPDQNLTIHFRSRS